MMGYRDSSMAVAPTHPTHPYHSLAQAGLTPTATPSRRSSRPNLSSLSPPQPTPSCPSPVTLGLGPTTSSNPEAKPHSPPLHQFPPPLLHDFSPLSIPAVLATGNSRQRAEGRAKFPVVVPVQAAQRMKGNWNGGRGVAWRHGNATYLSRGLAGLGGGLRRGGRLGGGLGRLGWRGRQQVRGEGVDQHQHCPAQRPPERLPPRAPQLVVAHRCGRRARRACGQRERERRGESGWSSACNKGEDTESLEYGRQHIT